MRGSVDRVGDWLMGKTLGSGHYGKVKLGIHAVTGEKTAIKILAVKRVKQEVIQREKRILKYFDHPHIVKLHEVIETDSHIYMVLELAEGGELFDYIVKKGRLSEDEARYFMRQLLTALEYSHAHSVIHRDLKLENILLDKEKNIKLTDFGLSNWVTPGQLLETCCGSPQYCAPEILKGNGYVGPEADIWSMGVILFAMVCGYLPFSRITVDNFRQLLRAAYTRDYIVEPYVSDECSFLIHRMLDPDPNTRITLEQIRYSRWIQRDGPLESILPEFEPVKEVDPDILMQLAYFGFKPVETRAKVQDNVKCQETTMYHLLAEKKRKKAASNASLVYGKRRLSEENGAIVGGLRRRNSFQEEAPHIATSRRARPRSVSVSEAVSHHLKRAINNHNNTSRESDDSASSSGSVKALHTIVEEKDELNRSGDKIRKSKAKFSIFGAKGKGSKIATDRLLFSLLTKKHGPCIDELMEDLGNQLHILGGKYHFSCQPGGKYAYVCTKDHGEAAFRVEAVHISHQTVYGVRCKCEKGNILAILDICHGIMKDLEL